MAKRIRVSDDSGVNYYTLPGNTGSVSDEAGEIDDTIFGQDFGSTQTGLIQWTIEANGLFKGFAGYVATIKKSGTPTAFTDEAMSLVSGKTYKITDATKNIWDRNAAVTFEDAGTPIAAADIEQINYLYGTVTFVGTYVPTGAITAATGSYLPTTTLGCANGFTLTQTANANDNTCMDTAKANDGMHTYEYGLKTVSLDLNGIYKAANGLRALLLSRAELIIEVNPDGNGKTVARGFFKPINRGQSGDVGDIEQETSTFNLSVPDDPESLMPYPFGWQIAADSTLSIAVQKCLTAWENKELVLVQYLADGTNGFEGDAVITDLSLAGGLEVMNEFTVNFQGSDTTTAVP